MKQSEKKLQGKIAFEKYYGDLYSERWQEIKNAFAKESLYAQLSAGENLEKYYLDAASLCAALCLPLENVEKVADLCAAPGGKTLAIALSMNDDAKLFSNEKSPQRKSRLSKVVETCLPENIKSRITTSCSDAATWCTRETESFDAILLDAPCSSERHVYNDDKYLAQWTPSRIKNIATEQWALLSSAFRLLKTNGFMIYATCAMNETENDGTLSKLIKKFPNTKIMSFEKMKETFCHNVESFKAQISIRDNISLEEILMKAEKTKHGLHILPDKAHNSGPLFFSLIQKISC